MAKQIIHKLVDDLDGGDADETVKFALDGVQYEIDLSSANAAKLRDAFASYVGAGTKVGRGGVVIGGRAARGRGGATAIGNRTRRSGSGPRRPARTSRTGVVSRRRSSTSTTRSADPSAAGWLARHRRRHRRRAGAVLRAGVAVSATGPGRTLVARPRPVNRPRPGAGKHSVAPGVIHNQWTNYPQPVDNLPRVGRGGRRDRRSALPGPPGTLSEPGLGLHRASRISLCA